MNNNCNEPTMAEYRCYTRRYLIFAIEFIMFFVTSFGNYQYSMIANLMTEYYGVSYVSINFTAVVLSITLNVLFYPVGRIGDIFGSKFTLVIGAGLLAFSAALKVIAVHRTLFWLVIVAQVFQTTTYLAPMASLPIVGSHWFPVNEMALLTGGVLAAESIGNCAPFILPSTVFKNAKSVVDIYNGLFYVNITETVVALIILFTTLLFVKDKPPTPVSAASVTYDKTSEPNAPLMLILRNKNLVLLLVYHAIIFSVFMSFMATLNQAVNGIFERSVSARIITIGGLLLGLSGMPASVIVGAVIKKYPIYKLMLNGFNITSLLSFIVYIISLWLNNEPLLYISLFIFGFSNFAVFTFSMDFVLEVSYPYPAGILYTLDTSTGTLPTFALTPITSLLMEKYGSIWANLFPLALIVISCLVALPVTEDLRRRKADQETQPLLDQTNSTELVC